MSINKIEVLIATYARGIAFNSLSIYFCDNFFIFFSTFFNPKTKNTPTIFKAPENFHLKLNY